MSENAIEKNLSEKMMETFNLNKEKNNPSMAIHATAVAAAGIVAVTPPFKDIAALRAAETMMVICIAQNYGVKLTTAAARGLFASSFAQVIGARIAEASLLAADAFSIKDPLVGKLIRSSIAITTIELVGHVALKHYEKKKNEPNGITTFDAMCAIGATADVVRLANAVTADSSVIPVDSIVESSKESHLTGTNVSFGSINPPSVGGHSYDYNNKKYIEAVLKGDNSSKYYYNEQCIAHYEKAKMDSLAKAATSKIPSTRNVELKKVRDCEEIIRKLKSR